MKICVSGSKGKMGMRISSLVKDDPSLELVSEFDAGDDARDAIPVCDCLIDFTTPEATMANLEICKDLKKTIVIGTTGFSEEEIGCIHEASKTIPVVFSPNMSIGVNLLFKIIKDAVKILGDGYDINIVEAHHVHKKDAPSGTAKEMARIIKDERGDVNLPIESVREADIVGEHTITFESDVDTLEITHSAKTRDIFAKGAILAAKWLEGKGAGLYSMKDVLGINS